ncbi:MAG: N-acylglucosamine 2-epimerase [Daejeonella sp.]|nr:N-acylglucosamine 2-epimerase [Daejeonella sp.]
MKNSWNYKSKWLISAFLLTIICSVAFTFRDRDEKLLIKAEMEKSARKELIDVWYPKSVDKEYGGFLSTFSYDFKPVDPQDKMIVTQSRHVWSNAKAAIFYPANPEFKEYAKHGYHFLRDVMWDKTNGGFYTLVSRDGTVKPGGFAPKEAYGNSFAIYALSAYYQASGDTSALNLAKKTFWWLEKNSHDPINRGYFQHMENNGNPISRPVNSKTNSEIGYKDQNSSIHLLESFTELYNVWPNQLLRERLQEMFYLVRDKITTPKGYLALFLKNDWTPISNRDSSEATILKNSSIDHVSFGHDVETAYLMLEASHVLGIPHDTLTLSKAKKMVDHALNNGWDNAVGGFYDEGYNIKKKPGITIIRDSKNWWAQAEGMNTLLLMSEHFPNDQQQYFTKFKQLWKYIKTYLIDHEHGDWYQGGIDKQPNYKTALKGQIWKGTYHNFRALMNCIQMLDPDTKAPTPVKYANRKQNTLSWQAATDNRNVVGYNIFENGKRIGFTPLLNFKLDMLNKKATHYSIKAIDLQGNESVAVSVQ